MDSDVQSSKRILPKVLTLEHVRKIRRVVSIVISKLPTPSATCASEGGLEKFDSLPEGGGRNGVRDRSRPGGIRDIAPRLKNGSLNNELDRVETFKKVAGLPLHYKRQGPWMYEYDISRYSLNSRGEEVWGIVGVR